jgi:hypothetical protein
MSGNTKINYTQIDFIFTIALLFTVEEVVDDQEIGYDPECSQGHEGYS